MPAGAFDVFLDHNTDNDPDTFSNLVQGPISAPVDVIVSFDAADLGTTVISVVIRWGYTPPSGDPECYDVKGSVLGFQNGTPLPDRGPFTNIVPMQCVCRGFRCFCDAELLIQASVSGLTQPGNHVLASLELSRAGRALDNCSGFVWVQSDFQAECVFPACASPGDPRAKMTLTDGSTAVESSSWGKVKALYQ